MSKFATSQAIALVILSVLAGPAVAVRDDGGTPIPPPARRPSLEDLKRLVDEAMPPDIKEDNGALLAALMKPQAAPAGPSDRFDIAGASRALRLRRAVPGKGCFLPPPRYDCTVADGTRGGGGAYKELQADSFGNLRFISRLADPTSGNPESGNAPPLPKFSKNDDDAIKAMLDMLVGVFHVPASEAPPADELKIEKLNVGVADPDSRLPPKIQTVAGVVNVPRLLKVDGLSVPTIPVLGNGAQGAMDDLGVFRIELDEWTRFTMPARLADARAPSRNALIDTIAEGLSRELAEMPRGILIGIAYAKGAQFSELSVGGNEEEPAAAAAAAGDLIPDEHRYVPVLVTSVAPTGADPSEEEQASAFSTGAMEMVTPLYELSD